MQPIVSANHKIKHLLPTIAKCTYVVGLCLLVEINFEDALAGQFIPYMNLLLVVTDEGFGVRVVEAAIDVHLRVLTDLCCAEVCIELLCLVVSLEKFGVL